MKLYHRTKRPAAKRILAEGFRLGSKHRQESGSGIYTVTSLDDANRPYNKKHYGDTIVRIKVPDDLVWSRGTKVEFIHLTKKGIHGNRIYTTEGTNGEVAVLNQVNAIISLEVSTDNGKTWLSHL